MTFNINEFKSKIDSYGGVATSSLFSITLIRRGNDVSKMDQDLTFFCHNVSMPGINLVTHPYRPNNIGIAQHMPIGIEAEKLDCLIYVDDQKEVLRFFHVWLQKIYNYSNFAGNVTPREGTNDHLPYEINYRSDYACVLVLRHYGKDGSYFEYTFNDVYPTDIGTIRLSWMEQASPMDLPVHFAYSSFRTSATRFGNPADVPFVRIAEKNSSGISQNTDPIFIRDLKNVVNTFNDPINSFNTIFPTTI